MSLFNCDCSCKCNCTLGSVIASVIIGIVTAFLLITGVITVTDTFLWVVFGIAVVYLAVLVAATAISQDGEGCMCKCSVLNTVLAGILGTILFSVVLLAVGIVATSVVSAILVGLLLASFSLAITASACYVKCLADCD